MPRNPDGTFSRVINWEEEQANNATFTGEKLDSDAIDLAQGIQDSVDVFGSNKMQATLNMSSNPITGVGAPRRNDDAVPYGVATKINNRYTGGWEFIDNGSDVSNLTFKLINPPTFNGLVPLGSVRTGFRFMFRCPLTYTQADIERYQGFEAFELTINGQVYSGNVIRSGYVAGKDTKPSFKFNNYYQMEMVLLKSDNWVFREFDYVKDGSLIWYPTPRLADSTPSGYQRGQYLGNPIANQGDYSALQKMVIDWKDYDPSA